MIGNNGSMNEPGESENDSQRPGVTSALTVCEVHCASREVNKSLT